MQAELQTQQPAGHSSRSVEGYFAVVKQHNSILATIRCYGDHEMLGADFQTELRAPEA